MKKRLIGILFCLLFINSFLWPATGESGERQNRSGPLDGYVFFAPAVSTTSYLINVSGEVVHTWNSAYSPRFAAYLLETGHLLRTAKISVKPTFDAGGSGGGVEEIDWDGTVVWDF